jgi:hypothetical protein
MNTFKFKENDMDREIKNLLVAALSLRAWSEALFSIQSMPYFGRKTPTPI